MNTLHTIYSLFTWTSVEVFFISFCPPSLYWMTIYYTVPPELMGIWGTGPSQLLADKLTLLGRLYSHCIDCIKLRLKACPHQDFFHTGAPLLLISNWFLQFKSCCCCWFSKFFYGTSGLFSLPLLYVNFVFSKKAQKLTKLTKLNKEFHPAHLLRSSE